MRVPVRSSTWLLQRERAELIGSIQCQTDRAYPFVPYLKHCSHLLITKTCSLLATDSYCPQQVRQEYEYSYSKKLKG